MTDAADTTLGAGNAPSQKHPPRNGGLERTIVGHDTDANLPQPDPAQPTENGVDAGLAGQSWVGRRLGKYLVTGLLGEGGMGVVLKALDETIEREVAIKLLSRDLSRDQVAMQRFLIEAKSAGKLSHSNTITIYEVGEHEGQYFLVLELATGGSAADLLEKHGAFSVYEATRITQQTCLGLAAAHQQGLVHRDIKPANLLLSATNSVKIADFGLARQTMDGSMGVTRAGQVVGTPYFMSPEQCESGAIDHRSDLYSLGATYYSLLTGRFPYQDSESIMKVMYAHCHASAPDPRAINPSIPTACTSVIARAMQKKPKDRYQSAQEMLADLDSILMALSGSNLVLPSQARSLPMVTANEVVSPETTRSTKPMSRRSVWKAATFGGGATTLLLLLGVIFGGWWNETPENHSNLTSGDPLPAPMFADKAPIRVGVLHSLSGTMSDSGTPVVDATLLAIAQVNAAGGLLGRQVEAVVADGRSDPQVFAREFRRLVTEENVCVVFGCWTSSGRKTVLPVAEELNHLLVYPVQYEGLEASPNIIYLGAAPNQQIVPALAWAAQTLGKKKHFIVGSDYVFPRVAGQIIRDYAGKYGAEIVGEDYLLMGTQDVGSTIDKIRASQPDVILNLINGDSNEAFFAGLRQAGVTPESIPTISFSIGEAELMKMNTAQMAGDYAAWNYFQSLPSRENREFLKELHARFGPQRVVTDPMEAAYIGVKLWAQAVSQSQTTEATLVRRAMLNERLAAPEGLVRLDAATQHLYKTPRIGRILENGQFEIVWTADAPVKPDPFPSTRTATQWQSYLIDLYRGWGENWAAGVSPSQH